nr:tRNA lysidine(34) synthetase TilS [Sphingomonas sp. Leaf357]
MGRPVAAEDVFAIAVSGGPDSMALLALAEAAWPGQVIAATVDHGLRTDAADEAAMVAEYCRLTPRGRNSELGGSSLSLVSHLREGEDPAALPQNKKRDPRLREDDVGCSLEHDSASGPWAGSCIPHTTLTLGTPLGTANLQAAARTARYALLIDWARSTGATILATAHHADDQAETFLMRAARGSGLAGLASIRPWQRIEDGPILLRPLLNWRRAELRAVAEDWNLPFVDDPSNASARYDRTRFRTLLTENPWLDAGRIARAAGHLAEADRDLRVLEGWLLDTHSLPAKPGERRIDVTDLPREVRRRLARAVVTAVRHDRAILTPAWTPASNIESLLDALEAGRGATQAGVMASATANIWQFRAAPPRRDT